MSLDSSLKSGSGLGRHRNVLNRTERLQRLLATGKMTEEDASVMGMPKVGHRKIAVGKKQSKKPEAEAATGKAGKKAKK